eukprot:m.115413 g.115413  ORF g.115413 m.115413 type:complete len:515 (+) comp15368_c0_seq1:42-1586(+)
MMLTLGNQYSDIDDALVERWEMKLERSASRMLRQSSARKHQSKQQPHWRTVHDQEEMLVDVNTQQPDSDEQRPEHLSSVKDKPEKDRKPTKFRKTHRLKKAKKDHKLTGSEIKPKQHSQNAAQAPSNDILDHCDKACGCGRSRSRLCRHGSCGFSNPHFTSPTEHDTGDQHAWQRQVLVQPVQSSMHPRDTRRQHHRRHRKPEKPTSRQTIKALTTRAAVLDAYERQLLKKMLRIQYHTASFSSNHTDILFNNVCTKSNYQTPRFRLKRTTKPSSGEPILCETAVQFTSTFWFEPPPDEASTQRLARQQLQPLPLSAITVDSGDNICSVCYCELDDEDAGPDGVVMTKTCRHRFHKDCIFRALSFSTRCPVCCFELAPFVGPQPEGTMSVKIVPNLICSGFETTSNSTIRIDYEFPSGIQDSRHEHPGTAYSGTYRTAFLPNTPEGRHILFLFQLAFDRRHLFRVGTSITTGLTNTVVWNSIHHKTYTSQGPFGYPDPTYFSRVKEELRACGIY